MTHDTNICVNEQRSSLKLQDIIIADIDKNIKTHIDNHEFVEHLITRHFAIENAIKWLPV